MSVDQPEVIDIVSQDTDGTILLVVSDHLPWHEPEEHIAVLKKKLDTYFDFIKSGQLAARFPETQGNHVQVSVKLHYKPHPTADNFFCEAQTSFEAIGAALKFEIFSGTPYRI
jgi:hypothetical protein